MIALAGNPNCGKTTLFNRLTGSRYRVGNRSGVTVEVKSGKWGGRVLADLPGIYSLDGAAAEEREAKQFLTSGRADAILNIIDASNLERSLWLTVRLAELGLPMMIALNMADQLKISGFEINIKRLAERLGVPVALISATRGDGCELLSVMQPQIPKKIADPEEWIRQTVAETLDRIGENIPLERSIKIDKILLGRFSIPILMAIMGVIFWLTFGTVGKSLSEQGEAFFGWISERTEELLDKGGVNCFLKSLVCGGILQSVGSVIPFFPQIMILFLCISLLEDVGYMSRAAFAADRFMSRIGLNGKAFLPLVTGFGCSVPAVMAARNVDEQEQRARTAELLPFFPCSAKMPVFIVFSSVFFESYAVIALYALSIAIAFVIALTGKKRCDSAFVLELPPYRRPTARNTLNQLREKLLDFAKRAGSILFIAGTAVWFFENFTFSLAMTNNAEESILGTVGKFFAPVFKPCGFGMWQAAVSLISGLLAKEAVISTLSVAYGGDNFLSAFTPESAGAFMVFVLLYPPCAAALSAMRAELSRSRLARLILRQLLLAWLAAVLTYFCLRIIM